MKCRIKDVQICFNTYIKQERNSGKGQNARLKDGIYVWSQRTGCCTKHFFASVFTKEDMEDSDKSKLVHSKLIWLSSLNLRSFEEH